MKKENRAWIFPVVVFLVILALTLIFALSAKGNEVLAISQPPNFDEFERWFGPRAKLNSRNDQLYRATKLLLEEMEKDSGERDLPGAIASNRCGIIPGEWQNVLGVAFSYRAWQEIYILRGEVAKMAPGVTKAEMVAEISRLESSLKGELQRILDGQTEINLKMDAIQKSIDDLAKKIGSQMESLLKDSKDQIRLLNDILSLLKGMDIKIDRIEVKIDQLLDRPQVQPAVEESEPISKEAPLEYYWPEEEEIKRFSLFGGIGSVWGTEEYPNVYGVLVDSIFEDPAWFGYYGEVGARYMAWEYLAPELFVGVNRDKKLFGGACLKLCWDVLNVGGGFAFLPNDKGKIVFQPTINISFETTSSWLRLDAVVVLKEEKLYLSFGPKFPFNSF